MAAREAAFNLAHRAACRALLGWPVPDHVRRPVFIVGCGRSGTTVLGRVLGHHPDVVVLNEPRYLWAGCFPESDIWSQGAARRGGRLELGRGDLRPDARRRLRRGFHVAAVLARRSRVVEKLPINTFRLDLIDAVFPDALYVHLVRHGVEVGRSIERRCRAGAWFAGNPYKWSLLAEQARKRPATRDLPEACGTDAERGLLEWRLSVEAAMAFGAEVGPERFLEVRYETLVVDPASVVDGIARLAGLGASGAPAAFAARAVARRSPAAAPCELTASALSIAGGLLAGLGYVDGNARAVGAAEGRSGGRV